MKPSRQYGWTDDSVRGIKDQSFLCQPCSRLGKTTKASEVHHLKGFKGKDDPARLDQANLESICTTCHLRETSMTGKTDNTNLSGKLALRRYFLKKYHTGVPLHVLDCCQGEGEIWQSLRDEFPPDTYWGVDVKPRRGRLKIDSVRILRQPGLPQNVIDIDTYGAPWSHFSSFVPNLHHPTTVFLTIGTRNIAHGNPSPTNYSALEMKSIGLWYMLKRFPTGVRARLLVRCANLITSRVLTDTCAHVTIVECAEVSLVQATRYIGIRLEPKTDSQGSSPDCPNHDQALKEPDHV